MNSGFLFHGTLYSTIQLYIQLYFLIHYACLFISHNDLLLIKKPNLQLPCCELTTLYIAFISNNFILLTNYVNF